MTLISQKLIELVISLDVMIPMYTSFSVPKKKKRYQTIFCHDVW